MWIFVQIEDSDGNQLGDYQLSTDCQHAFTLCGGRMFLSFEGVEEPKQPAQELRTAYAAMG